MTCSMNIREHGSQSEGVRKSPPMSTCIDDVTSCFNVRRTADVLLFTYRMSLQRFDMWFTVT